MQGHAIPAKTEAGRIEIEQRTLQLSAGLRSLLLLVDGRRDISALDAIARRIKAPADALDQLVQMALVSMDGGSGSAPSVPVAEAANPRSSADTQRHLILYALMTDASRAHLGLVGGYLTQLKIERADDAASLEALLPALQAGVAKTKGVAFAADLAGRIRAAAGIDAPAAG